MHLPEGSLLQNGKYKIRRFIKSGGFGCTYEGEQTLMDARVAIKELFISDICNREKDNTVKVGTNSKEEDFKKLKRSFINEASVLFKMKNPHIVRVTDVFEDNGTAYYVMDYIEGPSLADIISAKGKLSEEEALKYIAQVCEALKYVHSQNRMHMDIKPGNVMVDNNGDAVLIDFGTSKYYDQETGEQTSTLMGIYTKGYAPIEQIDRSFNIFCPPTDIYALGATLYKLLTGITPPDSLSLISRREVLKPLSSSISLSIRKAVEAAMQLYSENRPQTVQEFEKLLFNDTDVYTDEQTVLDNTVLDTTVKSDKNQNPPTNSKSENKPKNQATPPYNKNKSDKQKVENKDQKPATKPNTINGHEYVDLGLPSGVLWATCNIGAYKPEDHGEYYSWGEVKTKSTYTYKNSQTFRSGTFLQKLGATTDKKSDLWLKEQGFIDQSGNLNSKHDAATQNWGGGWRMPTKAEFEELIKNTTIERKTINGKKGVLLKSKINCRSIFLSDAGYKEDHWAHYYDLMSHYWSSTPYNVNSWSAYSLCFFNGKLDGDKTGRYFGCSIRPVHD